MPQSKVVTAIVFVLMLTATAFAQQTPPSQPAQPSTPPSTTPPANTPADTPQTPRPLTQADKDAIAKMLNDALVKGDEHPDQIICSATSLTCNPPSVFISAAAISDIVIKDIPASTRKLSVRVTAGESDDTGDIIVRRKYDEKAIPDHIIIRVRKARRFKPTYASDGSTATRQTVSNVVPTNASPARKYAASQSNQVDESPQKLLSDDPSIGFVSLGGAKTLQIQLTMNDDAPKTIIANLNYQRWFVDMGGFITFGFASDEELVTEDATAGNVRVLKKRHKDKIVPSTGIVLNFHPANYPAIAAQFGIATSVDRAASYYLGFGVRLRELGPRTLATFAAGIAATQVKRFPDVSTGDIRSATAPAITKGTDRYTFGPYLSLSLGFSFGGVEKPPANGGNGGS